MKNWLIPLIAAVALLSCQSKFEEKSPEKVDTQNLSKMDETANESLFRVSQLHLNISKFQTALTLIREAKLNAPLSNLNVPVAFLEKALPVFRDRRFVKQDGVNAIFADISPSLTGVDSTCASIPIVLTEEVITKEQTRYLVFIATCDSKIEFLPKQKIAEFNFVGNDMSFLLGDKPILELLEAKIPVQTALPSTSCDYTFIAKNKYTFSCHDLNFLNDNNEVAIVERFEYNNDDSAARLISLEGRLVLDGKAISKFFSWLDRQGKFGYETHPL